MIGLLTFSISDYKQVWRQGRVLTSILEEVASVTRRRLQRRPVIVEIGIGNSTIATA